VTAKKRTKKKGASARRLAAQVTGRERIIAGAALVLMLGLAAVGTRPSDAGTGLTLAGLVGLMYGIHKFGRLGEEEA
jgi:hypothetical protein